MSHFITDDFLLSTKAARQLYHDFAKDLPIIDYHCHLPPDEIASDKSFGSITDIWLGGDHYKWRAMRALGVSEAYITGTRSDREKFDKWAYAVPYTMRNPLYHWTHLELKRYFGIDELLNPKTADRIFDQCNERLKTPELTTQGIMKKMKVEVVCTTDDPADSLEFHQQLAASPFGVTVLPTFRPDNLLKIDQPAFFIGYINKLTDIAGVNIIDLPSLIQAIQQRVDFFHALGCRLSDHGLDYLHAADYDEDWVNVTLKKALRSEPVTQAEAESYKSCLLVYLGKIYHKMGWTQQFHLGALRNTNARFHRTLGADCGTDSIGDFSHAQRMARYFDRLDDADTLARTIIYNLNPADNEVFATMIGNYQDGTIAGKMQFGSGWWFLDQKDGMEKQMNALSNMGLLSQFVGMVTDSRSFLSYPRHEYFRRTLCNLIGRDVENGELPGDIEWLGHLVSNICYHNAKNYFGFESKK